MLVKVLRIFSISALVLAFDQNNDMIELGRTQYQVLREKGNLPRYGTCWKGALEYVEEGCKNLSEDSQSDMALHLTNCFLEQSGHDTYNCVLDKKANLRMICISSMTDRAFNVYTEFYTHIQNICWFLRGQIWYETISENSFKVGEQLSQSAKNQEALLDSQKESIEIQNKLLQQEKLLEQVLSDLYITTKAHKEILNVLTKGMSNFQSWVIGEISWIDSLIFYVISTFFIFIFTSIRRTAQARFVLLLFLFVNLMLERCICHIFVTDEFSTKIPYEDIYFHVWMCRRIFIFICISFLLYHSYNYKDLASENHKVLQLVSSQNLKILELVYAINNNNSVKQGDSFNIVNDSLLDVDETSISTISSIRGRKTYKPYSNLVEIHSSRYNLRSSRQNTPEIH